MRSSSSSAHQALQALGQRLRDIRVEAELSGRDLGRRTGWHSSKISKIEYGKQTPTAADIRAWCEHCGAGDQVADLVASLRAVEGMFVEWRQMERTGLRRAQETVLPLWERTRHFRIYSPRMIPGPLQTRAYITAVLTSLTRRRSIPDDVEQAVQVRVDKQNVIHEGDHQFAILLEENVLHHPIGGTETMAGQLGHLLTASTLPSVSLGIIPLDADRSSIWPVEGFWMFDEAEVTVELVSGHLTITQPHEITMYAQAFAELAELAVYGKTARMLITKAIAGLDV
ncbi:helix-turn-helix domain-containing protein [Planomonospora sp. ID67723]|uniref:helix-turn-helix domain-containing protein n=1 Tax=Planomonospora sp. ID67723 TaxID=2738134 RepID=UPI0018C3B596|nr:helix-turn-helix transcriptional regulator [Planomonospora sp. ID67723]MBG0831575.1 helix-turn-helix domain-containing protein [Planomonospora sp. ID67723]